MCGLFGVAVFDHSEPALSNAILERARAARDTLSHRGPDQVGEHCSNGMYMGHRRLSILDLSERGRQPMVSCDGSLAVTVNGEVYNFRDLRADLGEDRFRSRSDSEVILHGYESWGLERLLERLEGMFAFALHDAERGKVFLARDRPGIKPLYYGLVDDTFVWASELKAIEEYFAGLQRLTVDETALYDFLTYLYVPTPKSLYREIQKLEPAHWVEFDVASGKVNREQYWSLEVREEARPVEELAAQARSALSGSVQDQLISDVELGFFLSGGVDSSSVVALAAESGIRPRTFSIGYDVSGHDETEYAQVVADRFDTNHTRKVVRVQQADDLRERMRDWYDEPFGDTSALSTFRVSALAREHTKVVLTGDGGDEVFGGYRWYPRFSRFRCAQAPLRALVSAGGSRGPRTLLTRRTKGVLRKVARRVDLLSYFDPVEMYGMMLSSVPWRARKMYRTELGIPDDYDDLWQFRRFYRPDLPIFKRLQYLDFHTYLPDDILTKVDRVSMAVSLEARVPFLSREVIEFAFSVPEKDLYRDRQLKGLLKYAMADLLPPSIVEREKKGFSIPLHHWGSSVMGEEQTFQEHMIRSFL